MKIVVTISLDDTTTAGVADALEQLAVDIRERDVSLVLGGDFILDAAGHRLGLWEVEA